MVDLTHYYIILQGYPLHVFYKTCVVGGWITDFWKIGEILNERKFTDIPVSD